MNYFVYPGKYLLEIKGLICLTSNFSGFDLELNLNDKGHIKSEIFLSFENSYKISYITSIDTFSLSRIVYDIFWLWSI